MAPFDDSLSDIGVEVGHAPRLGMVGKDSQDDVVQGIVLMRYGGETPPTLEGIHQRVEHIKADKVLPPGMEIKTYYDRGDLVKLTTHTVLENLLVGMALVSIVLFTRPSLGHRGQASGMDSAGDVQPMRGHPRHTH